VNGGNVEPHSIGTDLRVPQEEALARDDPMSLMFGSLRIPSRAGKPVGNLVNLRRVPRGTDIPGGEWLDPLNELSDWFPDPPTKKRIHLVVQVPTPNDTKQDVATKEIIDIFSKSQTKGALNDITVHVSDMKTWAKDDIPSPLNCSVKLREDDSPDTHLDDVRSKLDGKRVLSDAALLGDTQYQSIAHAVFDIQATPESNMVSKCELDAFNNAVRNYMNWVESVRALPSSLKDGWFKSALVNPPCWSSSTAAGGSSKGTASTGVFVHLLILYSAFHAYSNQRCWILNPGGQRTRAGPY